MDNQYVLYIMWTGQYYAYNIVYPFSGCVNMNQYSWIIHLTKRYYWDDIVVSIRWTHSCTNIVSIGIPVDTLLPYR